MNKKHVIKLTEKQFGFLSYKQYELQALQNMINMFIENASGFEYTEEHQEKIIDRYTEAFSDIRQFVLDLSVDEGVQGIDINNYQFMYDEKTLYFYT